MNTQDELREQIKAAIEQDKRMMQETTKKPSGKSSNHTRAANDSKAGPQTPKVKKDGMSSSDEKPKRQYGPKKGTKYKMTAKGKKTLAKLGTKRLLDWQKENPDKAAARRLTHGAHSRTIRQRYSDKRTREGKALAEIISGLINDLGGPDELTTGHNILLSNIKAKLIVVMQIGKFSDRAESLINPSGEIIPALGRNFVTYTESLRRDIECLFGIKRGKAQQSYEKALNALKGGGA